MEPICEAMEMIDILNEEHDKTFAENVELKKENLELHKENHKLKFKLMISDAVDDEGNHQWGGVVYAWRYHRCGTGEPECLQDMTDELSDELSDAVDYGLEQNVILKEIYNYGITPPEIHHWPVGGCCEGGDYPCLEYYITEKE